MFIYLSVADGNFGFCERIAEYVGLVERLFRKRLFVLLNLKSALTREEQAEFFKAVSYKKLFLLLVENRYSERCGENEKIRIIDEDLCELS